MLGHEAQVYMVLPRCIHNMTGFGWMTAGFIRCLTDSSSRILRLAVSRRRTVAHAGGSTV